MGFLFVCANFSAIYAEENFNFSHNGLMFTLTVNAMVLAPEDTLSIRYRVTNLEHQGIVTLFSSSRRADIHGLNTVIRPSLRQRFSKILLWISPVHRSKMFAGV